MPFRRIFQTLLFSFATFTFAGEPSLPLPDGFSLVFEEAFDDEASINRFQFSDSKAWRWTDDGKVGGALELHQQSKYQTVYRSPFNIALIGEQRIGDFVMELDMRQTGKEYGHRDMCLFFGFQSPTQFYYTHIATLPDANAHNVFLVDNAARKSFLKIPEKGVDWGVKWMHVRLERIEGKIRVFFEDMHHPILSGEHDRFSDGAVGFGSFDDTGKVDNVCIWAKSSKKVEAVWFPAASTP